MAKNNWRGYGWFYNRKYYKSRSSNSLVRRSKGNLKAARKQTDQSSTVLNINTVIACKQPLGENGVENRVGATGLLSLFDLLRRSEFFGNYAPMYDQFRIDSVSLKLGIVGGAADSYFTIYTAWDRNGLDSNQFTNVPDQQNTMATNIGSNITTYSSAVSKNYVAGGSWNCSRSLSASNAQEKNQFVSTDSLKEWYNSYSYDTNWYDVANVAADNLNPNNPCYPVKSDVYPFKPCFLVGVCGLDKTRLIPAIQFTVEADVAVTFRGLRKSAIVNNLINLYKIDRLNIDLDNITASNDNQFFPGVINGVNIDTSGLDIVSLMRKVVLIKKYKDEDDKRKWKRFYDGAFEDGVYFGMINYAKKLLDENVNVEDGNTTFSLMIKPGSNEIKLFTSTTDLNVNNDYNIRYDEFCQNNFELIFPEKFEIRFLDIKNEIIEKYEVDVDGRNENNNILFNRELVKYEFVDDRYVSQQEVICGNMRRNYLVELKYFAISYIYMESEDNPVEYEFVIDQWQYNGSGNEITVRPDEGNVLICIVVNPNDGFVRVRIDKTSENIANNRYYGYIQYNRNDVEPLFRNRNNVEVDVQCFDRNRFCWLSFEDKSLLLSGSNTNWLIYWAFIGNNFEIYTHQ